MRNAVLLSLLGVIVLAAGAAWALGAQRPHNVIIFVADGLRSGIVDERTAPEMASLRREGVDFRNSHSLFPTITTVNGSAIATGHRIGDTGDFGNAIWVGQPTGHASNFAILENDDDQRGLARIYGGNYLNEESLLAAARRAGFSTAAVGKLGPTWVQDASGGADPNAILLDGDTGKPGARLLPADVQAALKATGLASSPPEANEQSGDFKHPGVLVSNAAQQDWMTSAVTQVLLPLFKARAKPFAMVFWSCDPDCTQHNNGDSLNTLTPGINGPTSLAGIRNADTDLARIRAALKAQGLDKTTDIFVTADHGFSVMSKASATSVAAKAAYVDTLPGLLPRGFFAIDLADALHMKLWDGRGGAVDAGDHPKYGGVLLGPDPQHPLVMVATNGGAELIYLAAGQDRPALARRIMGFLTSEDYVGGVFADDDLGRIDGALPLSAIGLKGAAKTPRPAMAVSFRSSSTGCANAELCAAEIADTSLQQGQGIHGSFSRADTHNFMAAIGPDFKAGYHDPAPVSNADITPTLAKILKLQMKSVGTLKGRAAEEALRRGKEPDPAQAHTLRSKPAANGFITVLNLQTFSGIDYLDAAGMPGRTVGLRP